MRIFAASIVYQHPDTFKAFLDTVNAQILPKGVSLAKGVWLDPSDPNCSANYSLASDAAWSIFGPPPKPDNATYAVSDTTHNWSVPTFHWLAQTKQVILEHAFTQGYDAVWLLDSDLLCSPRTLASLVAAQKPVVSGVFWTRWQPEMPALPQVWASHPYEFQGNGWEVNEFITALTDRKLIQVGGLGACTLISRAAFERGAYFWPLVPGLPEWGMWQGEDRHFCVRAKRNHVDLWADAWPDIAHIYRPEDRQRIPGLLEELSRPAPVSLCTGDYFSAQIIPMEESRASGHIEHVRGRMGAVKMLPQLEDELRTMDIAESRLLTIKFPPWYELADYRGLERVMQVTMLDYMRPGQPPDASSTEDIFDAFFEHDEVEATTVR